MPTSTDDVVVQITDLFPHKTQSNAILTPNFQGPRYFRALSSGSLLSEVALGADFTVTTTVSGLVAYLISTVEVTSNANDIGLTPAQALSIATVLSKRVADGLSLSLADINYAIQDETGDNGDADGVGKGNTTATVKEILQILSGNRVYTLPATTDLGDEGANNVFIPLGANTQASFFSTPKGTKDISSYDTSFLISARSGQIARGQSRKTKAGLANPVIVAYNDDGSLILQ